MDLTEDMLLKYFPEVIPVVTKEPVVCSVCMVSLTSYLNFIKRCWNVENKVSHFCESIGINSEDQINLHNVLRVISPTKVEHYEIEEVDVKPNMLKEGEELDIKYEEIDVDMEQSDMKSSQNRVLQPDAKSVLKYTVSTTSTYESKEPSGLEVCPSITTSKIALYKCETCPYQSKSRKYLNSHMLVHMNPSEVVMFKCGMCMFASKYKRSLSYHMMTHFTPDITYKCEVCTHESKSKGNLSSHMLVHKNPLEVAKYKCDVCPYEAKYRSCLIRHMNTHKDFSEITMYICEMCPFAAKHKDSLYRHMMTHKVPELTLCKRKRLLHEPKRKFSFKCYKNSSGVLMYKCTICMYESKTILNIKHHILAHNGTEDVLMYKCKKCGYEIERKDSQKSNLESSKDASVTTAYKCGMCTEEIMKCLVLMDPPKVAFYRCKICKFETKQMDDLKTHMLFHKNQSGLLIYKCEKCIYETVKKKYLNRHMLTHKHHSEVELYKCEMCTYETKRKVNLKIHMLIHSRAIVYTCEMCKYNTVRKVDLSRHMRIHKDVLNTLQTQTVCS